MRRYLVCAAGVVALLTTLTGCYGLQSETLSQKDTIGAVHVTTTMCGFDPKVLFPALPPGPGARLQPVEEPPAIECADDGRLLYAGLQASIEAQQWALQPLVAYRVPDGTQAPATLTATDGLIDVPLVRSDDVAATLPAATGHETPTGSHWVGYRGDGGTMLHDLASPDFQLPDINATDVWTIDADFGLPSAARPFRGPFGHDVVVAWRLAADEDHITTDFDLPPDCGPTVRRSARTSPPQACARRGSAGSGVRRAVAHAAAAVGVSAPAAVVPPEPNLDALRLDRALNCDQNATDIGDIVDPGPDQVDPSYIPLTFCGLQTGDAHVETSVATRDLGIGAPAAVPAVQQGTTGTVTFPVRFAGADGPSFALSAATTVPGGSAAPAQATFTPAADASTDQAVTVTVPAGTTLGTYDVTLTATVGGQVRTATGRVTVVEPPPPPVPDVTFHLPGETSVDGHTVNIGTATCTKPSGKCEAPVYLMTRNGQLHSSNAAAAKVRLLVLARTRVKMKAGKTVKLILRVGPKVRRTLQRNYSIRGRVSTRQKWAGVPSSQRLWLRPHKKHKHG